MLLWLRAPAQHLKPVAYTHCLHFLASTSSPHCVIFFFTVISQLCFHHTWGRSCFSQGLLVAKLLSPVTHFLPSTLHYLLNLLPTTPKHPLLTLLYVSTTPLPAPPTKLCSDTHAHSLAIPHPRLLGTGPSSYPVYAPLISVPAPAENLLVPSPAALPRPTTLLCTQAP